MRLNDIWRKVNAEIGFYTSETFANIPAAPGVYAWFYPLRIVTKDLNAFMNEINLVLNYDCESQGRPYRENSLNFIWEKIYTKTEIQFKDFDFSSFKNIWEDLVNNPDERDFNELRKIFMRASVFLPPLYVGKTTNLRKRCQQHIIGTNGDNNFNKRFQSYASLNNFTSKSVSELIFVSIKTKEEQEQSSRTEELVEFVLKHLSKPKYSKI